MTRPEPRSYAERLATAHRIVNVVDDLGEQLMNEVPVWWRDQLSAAHREATRRLREAPSTMSRIEDDGRWDGAETRDLTPTLDQAARLLAALLGCSPCLHLRRGTRLPTPDMVVADLNHRLVLCRRCAATVRRPIDDDRCEVCDEPVVGRRFRSFVVLAGGALYVGNRGECCADPAV